MATLPRTDSGATIVCHADRASAGGPVVPTEPSLNLKQVANRLGVHYMTAYRYVRRGQLPARRDRDVWLVAPVDLAAFELRRAAPAAAHPRQPDRVDRVARLVPTLLAGDEVAAWQVIDAALAAGHSPERCFTEVLSGAMQRIGDATERGELSIADPYLATATAQRVAARLGARFRRRGRSRGTVVLGAPRGERHALPITLVADVIRLAGFTVLELGADVPAEAFVLAAERAERLVAVTIGVTGADHLAALADTVVALRDAHPEVPVVIGGQAVRNHEIAHLLGVDHWAADAEGLVAVLEGFVPRSRAVHHRADGPAVGTVGGGETSPAQMGG